MYNKKNIDNIEFGKAINMGDKIDINGLVREQFLQILGVILVTGIVNCFGYEELKGRKIGS